MKHTLPTLVLLLAAGSALAQSKPKTLVQSGYDEEAMEAAIERARDEVDSFIAELAEPTGTKHAVKARIDDGDKAEHFWLLPVAYRNGKFRGKINNHPGVVKNVKLGQTWTLDKAEISDWMFMRDGKMHGNYTLRPLLETMPEQQAARIRAILASP